MECKCLSCVITCNHIVHLDNTNKMLRYGCVDILNIRRFVLAGQIHFLRPEKTLLSHISLSFFNMGFKCQPLFTQGQCGFSVVYPYNDSHTYKKKNSIVSVHFS